MAHRFLDSKTRLGVEDAQAVVKALWSVVLHTSHDLEVQVRNHPMRFNRVILDL